VRALDGIGDREEGRLGLGAGAQLTQELGHRRDGLGPLDRQR
jgi:hypothetical protein